MENAQQILYFKDKNYIFNSELIDANYLEALEDYGFESITDEWAAFR